MGAAQDPRGWAAAGRSPESHPKQASLLGQGGSKGGSGLCQRWRPQGHAHCPGVAGTLGSQHPPQLATPSSLRPAAHRGLAGADLSPLSQPIEIRHCPSGCVVTVTAVTGRTHDVWAGTACGRMLGRSPSRLQGPLLTLSGVSSCSRVGGVPGPPVRAGAVSRRACGASRPGVAGTWGL